MQMFSRSRKVEPAAPMSAPPPPAQPAAKPNPTPNGTNEVARTGGTLSSGVSIKGSVKFEKELTLDCEVEGRIDSQGRLTVGKQAKIKGDIEAPRLVVDEAASFIGSAKIATQKQPAA